MLTKICKVHNILFKCTVCETYYHKIWNWLLVFGNGLFHIFDWFLFVGVLVDYFVLLPSEYYEPSILDLTITVPCTPELSVTEKECVMFTHANLDAFTNVDLVADAPRDRYIVALYCDILWFGPLDFTENVK